MLSSTSRRKFIRQSGLLLGGTLAHKSMLGKAFTPGANNMQESTSGEWLPADNGMPVFQYNGKLPFVAFDKEGKDANLPEDPYFLLGNYRMTLITHASGIYQLLSAERAWARVNAGGQTNYGWNEASLTIKNKKSIKKTVLTGINSIASNPQLAQKYFGVGFARYEYQLENQISCSRIISVKPSEKINSGNPCFVITVVLKNNGKKTQEIEYTEKMKVNYVMVGTQYTAPVERPVSYQPTFIKDDKRETVVANIKYTANHFFVMPSTDERFPYDIAPSSVFMHAEKTSGVVSMDVNAEDDIMACTHNMYVKPGESISFNIIIGLTNSNAMKDAVAQVKALLADANNNKTSDGLFAQLWKNKLPDLSEETNTVIQREMLWNAHFMEASAKYSAYYKETFIPQGTVYSYYFGTNISNRDHLAAVLPACYTNPPLAKSILRYALKHADLDGEIKRGNSGFGYSRFGTAESAPFKESDEQLYFFNSLAEYLLITKDYAFLKEKINYYPAEEGREEVVLTLLKKLFVYLRDEIGLGPNGLVKMLNSDWSDSFFHEYSPNVYASTAESHLNSAMLVAVFPKLITALEQSRMPEETAFIAALKNYHDRVRKNYLEDLGDRKFSARAYLNSKIKFGLDNVCLEPQGYLLQIPGLSNERKKEIYEYVKSKLLTPEKIGMRTREKSLWGYNPEGEDGGIWFSLEYPVLLGVATFDKAEAWRLLEKFSFDNYTKKYPKYWVGQWTAADEVNSTLYREGLYAFWVPSQDRKHAFQGYCNHPHTWPLYCYFKLKE